MREIFVKKEHLIRDVLGKKYIFLVQLGNPICQKAIVDFL